LNQMKCHCGVCPEHAQEWHKMNAKPMQSQPSLQRPREDRAAVVMWRYSD